LHNSNLIKINNPETNSLFIDFNQLYNYLCTYNFKYNHLKSLDQQYQYLNFTLRNIINNSKVSYRINKKNKSPWISNDILVLIRRKENLFKKVRKYPWDIVYKLAYRTHVSELKRLIKSAKSNYFQNKFENCSSTKQKWNLVNKLCHVNKPSTLPTHLTDSDMASQFNTQFNNCTIISTNEIRDRCLLFISPSLNSFVFLTMHDYDVSEIINSFTNTDSVDSDGISMKLLKCFSINNSNFISNFINQSLDTHSFPVSLKKATITPIYKTGNKNILSNYRPISILPSFSKIIEKALSTKMYNFLNHSNFFADNQYGFIKGKNTESALLEFNRFIYNSIDKNKKTAAIFLDISKAFDSVNHSLLILKLEHAGFRGNILNWFISYLSNRQQRVKIGNNLSDYVISNCGVPQGSILGPLLFLIFINDFCKLKLFGKMITYADDSALLYSCVNNLELKSQIEADLIEIGKWFAVNDLSLNLNKTKYIYFNLKQPLFSLNIKFHLISCLNNLNCNCQSLEQVQSIKYLGLHIDANLKWKTHIGELCKRLRFILIKFHYLKNKVSQSFLKTLYYSWFFSLINYGIIIWGCDYKTNLLPLISIQNKCFKILSLNSSNAVDFRNLELLPIRHIVCYRIIIYLYRNRDICSLKNQINQRRSNEIYQIPRFFKEIFRKHFFYIAPKIFNKLPSELQNISSFPVFKKSIFNYILLANNVEDLF